MSGTFSELNIQDTTGYILVVSFFTLILVF